MASDRDYLKKPSGRAESGGETVTVLAVASPAGIATLRRIFSHSRWRLLETTTILQARDLLRDLENVIVLCEAVLPDGTWKDVLLSAANRQVIVAAHHADDYLWMEVLNHGAYNVLAKPFEEQELFRMISLAWLHRHRRALLSIGQLKP